MFSGIARDREPVLDRKVHQRDMRQWTASAYARAIITECRE